ncbi:hypothetical protein AMTR_s00011p00264820 [Amborella trichopoda]|uniref:Phosphatidylinositol-glycan biosynthesis class F protein n=1 Tax=Amborella trichopoda TaxID=13333 RepID=W1NG75_AMBTC|nr:hypothetical protein AMTR_s00011p00264820 [Amborella trichopoda]
MDLLTNHVWIPTIFLHPEKRSHDGTAHQDDYSVELMLSKLFESPIVILGFSLLSKKLEHCSLKWAILRGLLGLPAGALVNAFGAIVFGAPVGIKFLTRTVNWALLMSLLTVVPTASVYGSSWKDWQRLYAHSKPITPIDYAVCLPAHGAVIGAWFGAWPMPLDWDRPWQEWPICVTYGAIIGHTLGTVASFIVILLLSRQQRIKRD